MELMNLKERITITSNMIAELTGKEHGHVKRDIEKILKELNGIDEYPKLATPNLDIIETTFISLQNKEVKNYTLTQDGMMLVITGYSAIHRMKLIKYCRELENKLTPKSYGEALIAAGKIALEKERLEARGNLMMLQREDSSFRHIKTVLADKRELEEELEDTQKELGNLNNYYTIIRVQKLYKGEYRWQDLKKRSRTLGFEVKKVPCPRYGTANAYHSEVWGEVYGIDL
jgi:Rha family phage regulatory protein